MKNPKISFLGELANFNIFIDVQMHDRNINRVYKNVVIFSQIKNFQTNG